MSSQDPELGAVGRSVANRPGRGLGSPEPFPALGQQPALRKAPTGWDTGLESDGKTPTSRDSMCFFL